MTNLKLLRSLSIAGALLCLALHPTFANADGIFEGGVVPNPGVNGDVGGGFTTVNFQQTYSSVPVVFLLTTNVGGDPAAIRINNVTTSGFDAVIAEPPGPGAGHSDMTGVSYIAVLPGRYELPNGSILEAGRHNTSTAVWGDSSTSGPSNAGGGHDTVNFTSPFPTSPVVLADIQTMVNETPPGPPAANSVPWLTTSIDNAGSGTPSITVSGFDVALERAETGTGNVAQDETIGYLAITSGHGTISSTSGGSAGFDISGTGTVEFDAGISGDVIEGWTQPDAGADGTGNAVSFTSGFAAVPEVVVASLATRDGGDGGWLRANLSAITASGLKLATDEDTAHDGERGHTPERASIVAFGNAFTASSAPMQEVHFDDGSSHTGSGAVNGSGGGNSLWSNNINWRVETDISQTTPPNDIAPGVTDRANIALDDLENSPQPAFITPGDSFEVSAVRIGGNFGEGAGGDGVLNVDGGTLTVSGTGLGSGIALGFNGRDGKLNISNGALVDITAGNLLVGVENGNAQDVSEVRVTGASTLNVAGSFQIGGNQNTNADANTRGTVVVGNSMGTDNPIVNVNGGNTEVARGGIGRFTLNSGEFNQNASNFVLAQTRNTGSTSNTDAIVDVNGGALTIAGTGQLNMNGGLSVFNHNGGDVIVGGHLQMATANDTTSNATYNLDAGTGSLSIGGNLYVGRDRVGEFNYESGNFSITGAILLGGVDSNTNPNNRPNAHGTFNIGENAGTPTLNTNQFEVGRHNIGIVNQFGGDVHVNGANNLVISQLSASTGTYNMMGGTLDVGDPAGANGHINFNQGTSLFNQTGGDVTVNRNVQMANTNSGAMATYDISGGTLDVTGGPSDLIRIGIAGTGVFIARGDAQVDAGTITVGESNNANRLDIRESAIVNTGHLDVADGGSAVRGTVNQTGGTLNVTALTTYEVGAGGLATVNHSGGTANVTGNLNIGTDTTAGDSYTLSNSGTLNFGDTAGVTQVLGSTPSTMTVGVDGDFVFEGGTLANVTDIHVHPSNSPFTVGDNDFSDIARMVVGVDGGLDPDNAATTRAYTTISDGGGINPDGTPQGTPINFVLNADGVLAVDVFGFGSHGINGEQGGTLQIDPLDPALDSDILHVTGDADLDGTLDVNLNGFEPFPFAWYDVLFANGTINDDDLSINGVHLFRVVDNPNEDVGGQILQVAVPEPASIAIWSLLGLALAGFGYRQLRK